jgi:acyl-coenzyme A synthetase/AMP-(fatty) acid ligase
MSGETLNATLAAIKAHAQMRPNAPAILTEGRSVSYKSLWLDICRTISALAPIVPPPESLAAVEWKSPYWHVLLLLALEHYGIATATYRPQEIAGDYQRLFAHSDLVLAETVTPSPAARTILCDARWWESALSGTIDPADIQNSTTAQSHRIACSSGTTGSPKFMMRRHAQSELRFANNQKRLALTKNSRLILPASFAFQANYLSFISCMRIGALCIFVGDKPLFKTLQDQSATHMIAIPMEFTALKSIKDGAVLPSGLRVMIIGGSLSPSDRSAWQKACPTGTLIELYGTNETGTIALMSPDKRGKIDPNIEVQIVDDTDTPRPYGEVGHVRVRGPACATDYLFEAQPNPTRFRDGWFYPGDLAILEDANHLKLLGRDDDLLNISGFKMHATIIEDIAKSLPEIIDCCASTVLDPLDSGAVWLGVVFAPDCDFSVIQQKLKPLIPISTNMRVYAMDAIPRGPTGKILRHKITDHLRQHIHMLAQSKV